MTSPSPLVYGETYHIYNRGINRENISIEERNYSHFFNLYTKYINPVVETFAYCLLKNHFHILVRVKLEEEILRSLEFNHQTMTGRLDPRYPSNQFSNFFNAYAKAINSAYGRDGSLFKHPFGRVRITSDEQFAQVILYIHQNPQKHGFVDDFREWRYSSYGVLLSEKPTHLKRAAVLELFGGNEQYTAHHKILVAEVQSNEFADDENN